MTFRIRPLDGADAAEVARVADRMRATLVEVLGAERGAAMYTAEWLRDRVRAHLDPRQLDGAGFVAAADDGGDIVGHLLARPELDDGRPIGLIATVWVEPAWRGRGIATALFDAGEAWLRGRGLAVHAYDTAGDHAAMQALLERRGYRVSFRDPGLGMVRFARPAAG